MKVRNVPNNKQQGDEFELPPLNGWDPAKDKARREHAAEERARLELRQSQAAAREPGKDASSHESAVPGVMSSKDTSSQKSFMHKEVHITLNAGKLAKGVFFLALFMVVFYAGRLSVAGFGGDSGVSDSATAAVTAEEPEEEVEPATATEPKKTATVTGAAAAETAPSEPEEEAAAPATADTAEETVVTSYASVGVTLNKVTREWKETYGRIVELDYTITNGESGTIKPAYFMMTVEGYDFEKKMLLAKNSQSLPAKSKLTTQVRLPSPGYTYSSDVSGDLKDVTILLSLYDAGGSLMASYSGAHDLSG
ncbi:hypothetical protein HYS49_01455 [Candidatus Woesearchaeota archaeon]|nr:hypothetical protein [Candidatus Woesearchaeota archaeon]